MTTRFSHNRWDQHLLCVHGRTRLRSRSAHASRVHNSHAVADLFFGREDRGLHAVTRWQDRAMIQYPR